MVTDVVEGLPPVTGGFLRLVEPLGSGAFATVYAARRTQAPDPELPPVAETVPGYEVVQWLMFQMGGVGPMFGQANYFFRAAEKVPQAIDRYHKEALRLYGVLDKQLSQREFLASEYSIADIATYPWVSRHEMHHVKLEQFANVKRWFDMISARPAVQRGMAVPKV